MNWKKYIYTQDLVELILKICYGWCVKIADVTPFRSKMKKSVYAKLFISKSWKMDFRNSKISLRILHFICRFYVIWLIPMKEHIKISKKGFLTQKWFFNMIFITSVCHFGENSLWFYIPLLVLFKLIYLDFHIGHLEKPPNLYFHKSIFRASSAAYFKIPFIALCI